MRLMRRSWLDESMILVACFIYIISTISIPLLHSGYVAFLLVYVSGTSNTILPLWFLYVLNPSKFLFQDIKSHCVNSDALPKKSPSGSVASPYIESDPTGGDVSTNITNGTAPS